MISKKLIVCGLGNVGKAFLELLANRTVAIEDKYGLSLVLGEAVDINGSAIAPDGGLPPGELLDHLRQGGTVETFGASGWPGLTGAGAISEAGGDVLIEATPTSLTDGEPGWTHIKTALGQGMEVVTANKGPIVLFYDQVHKLARQNGGGLHLSAATAAALPTLDVGRICLAGANVQSVEGLLNGTTNYILTRMTQENCPYDVALKAAQDLGIAETDPSKDVEGYDTATKIVIIANRIFDASLSLDHVDMQGITHITPADIANAKTEGAVIKLVGLAELADGVLQLSVGPKKLDKDHPLASVNGSEKAISYMTDTMDRITVMGGKSSPVGAAAALLKDLINACVRP